MTVDPPTPMAPALTLPMHRRHSAYRESSLSIGDLWAHRSATEQRSCLGNAPTNPGVLADEASNEGEAVAVCSDGVVARESVGEHPCSR
jgi:hypothetical protein